MIESTVSRGADVTSSACPAMSTRQLGAKHSITKRSTRGLCMEVRLTRMARPRRVRAPRLVLSSLVARGLAGHFAKGRPVVRSWLKTYGCECGNASVTGRISRAAPTAPVRPWGGPRAPAAGVRRLGDRGARRAAFGLAQQHPAGGRHGGEAEGGGGRPADGRPVHDQHDRDDHTAERRPAHHVARRVGRGADGLDALSGADGRAGTKAPWRRRGDRSPTRSGAFRSLARTSTGGSVTDRWTDSVDRFRGQIPWVADGRSTAVGWRPGGRPRQTAVDAKRHCHPGQARACSLERRVGAAALGRRGVSPYPWGMGQGR